MKYHLITYGCQMNKSDSERIASVLEKIGYKSAPNKIGADLIVVNSCSVRQSAIDRIWGQTKEIEKLKMQNEKIKTILTGCVLSEDKEKFKEKFDFILDIKDLAKLPEILKLPTANCQLPTNYLEINPKYHSALSAYVPIMTGCNNFCAYCAVPHTRGREISRPVKEIICEIKNLIKRDYKEIVLLGQNVNSYKSQYKEVRPPNGGRTSKNSINFPKLLYLINDLRGNFRIKFLTSHPKDMSGELIETVTKCQKVVKEIHLPVQSGDNEILRKMNRGYTVAHYKNLIKKIRRKIPDVKISTDIIVGFPGETKKQFENTAKLVKEIKFDKSYIAKYSPRPGTIAARLKDNVLPGEKKRRGKALSDLL